MSSLITKEIEIGLNSSNINYYESLGYKIPKYKVKNCYKYSERKTVKGKHLLWLNEAIEKDYIKI